ncbi:2-hydroxyacid dehydrogenase [Nostocoides vanveenii]|jgi:phosphoglycerate dehydrogenase-like enzyme|uniref:2-hydroxyacid dehydrogenase n=1 Tax=Nostocoides vanveenii TaxID=330835 RepID=A0ABN2K987_9MICO
MFVSFPDADWRDDVGPIDGITPVVWHPRDPGPDAPVDAVVAPYVGAARSIAAVGQVPSVRFVQLLTAGYDGILEQLPESVSVANAAGVHDDSTAEMGMALALASQRGLPGFARAQPEGDWTFPGLLPSLADRRVLIVGYGSVGRALGRRLVPFQVELTAVAGHARDGDDLVDRVHPIENLPELLPTAEVVFVVVPLSDVTRGLIGEDFLAALPDDALVVNIARGPVADTDALLRHTGRLRFALDVTDPEPLPPDHPLWRAPNVLISPHVGGASSAFRPRALRMLREQLTRLARGEEPAHVVGVGARPAT